MVSDSKNPIKFALDPPHLALDPLHIVTLGSLSLLFCVLQFSKETFPEIL